MTPFIARTRYYHDYDELLVIAITDGDPPQATCVTRDGELVVIGVTDLRVIARPPDWPTTESASFVGEPRTVPE